MTALQWDQVGERRFETGIDRGVLYLLDGTARPWNGLTSINEVTSRESKPFYIDGIKFLDHKVPGSYSAKLTAYTYPDELDELMGDREYAPGLFVHDQPSADFFHLSYRTRVGNDLEGIEHGYKIHIIYNAMLVLSDPSMSTVGDQVSAQQFEWAIFATPAHAPGIRPTAHISLDSRRMDPVALAALERLLYGDATVDPDLPTLPELLALF